MKNPADSALIVSPEGRQKYADAVVRGIAGFLGAQSRGAQLLGSSVISRLTIRRTCRAAASELTLTSSRGPSLSIDLLHRLQDLLDPPVVRGEDRQQPLGHLRPRREVATDPP